MMLGHTERGCKKIIIFKIYQNLKHIIQTNQVYLHNQYFKLVNVTQMGPMVYYVMIVMVNVLVNPMSLDTNVSNVLLVIGIFLHVQVCEKYYFKL